MLPRPSMHRDLRRDQQAKLPQSVLAALPRMRKEKFPLLRCYGYHNSAFQSLWRSFSRYVISVNPTNETMSI